MDCDCRQQRHSVPTMLPVVDILTLSQKEMSGKIVGRLHWNDMNEDCNIVIVLTNEALLNNRV